MPVSPLHHLHLEGINTSIYTDKESLGAAAADFVAAQLLRTVAEKGEANLVLATGASQYEFLSALRQHPEIEWSKITAFHLDEYINLPETHPASFRHYLRERFFNHVTLKAVHLLDGNADPALEIARYTALLAEHPIDIACIGIGENGHLAFNDPPADFETKESVLVVDLDEACRMQQVGEGHFANLAAVPPQALSLSIPAILSAQVISCVVPDQRKAEAVRNALEGPITPMCPASALRQHPNCHLFLDTASASLLATLQK